MRKLTVVFWSLLAVIVLAGCGSSGPGATPLPTATTIPTYVFEVPTEAPSVGTAAAATRTAAVSGQTALDPLVVERGKGRYEALECVSCHGAIGEGTDKGSALVNYTKSEAEFIDFMRSGGTLGPDHQFSTNRLSDSGGKNLYQYLVSLRTGS
jgi:hypothetical protein